MYYLRSILPLYFSNTQPWYENKKATHFTGKFLLGISIISSTFALGPVNFFLQGRVRVIILTGLAVGSAVTFFYGMKFYRKREFWQDPAYCQDRLDDLKSQLNDHKSCAYNLALFPKNRRFAEHTRSFLNSLYSEKILGSIDWLTFTTHYHWRRILRLC